MDWFRAKTAHIDAWVAAGATGAICWWFGSVLHVHGAAAVWAAIFGLTQLGRFINAQLATLEWARLYEAVVVEKTETPPKARVEGYREASAIEEAPNADDEQLAHELPRRRRNARVSLAVTGALAALGITIPSLVLGHPEVVGIAGLLVVLMAVFFFTMRQMQRKPLERPDYFMQHLERDTKAMLAKKKGAAEPVHVRVGVDFGVPAEELEEESPAEELQKRKRTAQ